MSAFTTEISEVVPGEVRIRGYSHEELILHESYATGAYLTLVGELPSPGQAAVIDAMLMSLLDHGFVAATVSAARYAASGNPEFVPAVCAGLLGAGRNTLSPEHSCQFIGGVLKRVQEGASFEVAATEAVSAARERRERIPGIGHPTHKDSDFRATAVLSVAQREGVAGEACEALEAIHAAVQSLTGKTDLPINIDGCLAAVGMDLGLSVYQIVSIALLSVLPGLMAHVDEEIRSGKPLRFIEDGEYSGVPKRQLPTAVS